MDEPIISQREFRNDISSVLRRVEEGERFVVTVSGRPVAEVAPLGRRPRFLPAREIDALLSRRGDTTEFKAWYSDFKKSHGTTDDIRLPWSGD
ncbi:MAG: type II toxin-antitoxin system prevent-host-death family antitoxin [Actinomycetota bacterium]